MQAKQTVLVVGDEEGIRDLIHELLDDDYDVLLADDGLNAVGCYTNHAERIAAVITDVPRVNGAAFVEWLRQQDAKLPIIAISNSIEDVEEHLLRQKAILLKKPFHIVALVTALKRVLGSSSDEHQQRVETPLNFPPPLPSLVNTLPERPQRTDLSV